MEHRCYVHAGIHSTQGYFALEINGRTQIRMRRHPSDGICRGTIEHWKGDWTPIAKISMQMAFQGVSMAAPKPVAGWGALKANAPRPWGDVAKDANAVPNWAPNWAPTWGTEPSNHPSGLDQSKLEECSACSGGGSSGLPGGMCSDCYGTGQMPKQQTESNEMNMQEMITVMQIQQGAKIVAAKYFTNSGQGFTSVDYHFKNALSLALAVGDLAVAQTKGEYALIKIVDPDVRANALDVPLSELKHIVSKVDLSAIKIVTEAENSAMHALALSEVTERMNKFKEQIGNDTFNTMQGLLALPSTKE
jgi:hypothetical protein